MSGNLHRRWVSAIAALGLLAGAVGGCSQKQTAGARRNGGPRTATVERQDLQPVISTSGKVVPRQSVNVSPRSSGRLSELYVDQGDRVKKGQVIAKMDDREEQAQLLQAEAALKQAEARLALLLAGSRPEEIAQTKAQIAAAKARLQLSEQRQRQNADLQAKGFVSQDEAAATQTDLAVQRAALDEAQKRLALQLAGNRQEDIAQARAQVAQAKAQLAAARLRLDETTIRAPFAGVITQKYANPGAFVTPTTSASSTSSATSSSIVALAGDLEVLADVPEADLGQLHVGQAVEIKAETYAGKTFRGKVRLIAPEAIIVQNVTSFEVRVALEDGADSLRSGMSVDVRFVGQPIANALVVPSVSVVSQNNRTGVWVPGNEGAPEFRPVTLGITTQDKTQILSGLDAGDKVLMSVPRQSQGGPSAMQLFGGPGAGGRRM